MAVTIVFVLGKNTGMIIAGQTVFLFPFEFPCLRQNLRPLSAVLFTARRLVYRL